MAVPKRKTTPGRRNRRRSHLAVSGPALSIDAQTKSVHYPHHVDLTTGMYRGKQVLFREAEESEDTAESTDE